MRKYYTVKDTQTNKYVFAIMVNGIVFLAEKPTVYSTKRAMNKLIEKLCIKYPTLSGRLILESDCD